VLGVGLQWLGATLRIPSIVLLLAGGLVAGPVLGWVEPNTIFGAALFPVVSLAVGLLLFAGGLELRLSDLRGGARGPVLRLVTLGAVLTWLLVAAAAQLLFDQPVRASFLLGAVLVVSGPTVVGPLLHHARPADPDATILRWEGIVIDPLGATLGLFCVNAFFVSEFAVRDIWGELVVVALAGVAAGVVAAAVLVLALRRMVVPDELEVAVALALVVAAYGVAEAVRPEAGLFATTTMGLALANQQLVPVRQLRVFTEPVVALLIGGLFIVLAAGVELGPLGDHLPAALVLAALIVLVVRPLVVAACTVRSPLPVRERAFLACLAPKGVVAASTAALFSLRLEQIGQPDEVLLPVTFAVVVALAVVYGLGSIPAARWLGVARPEPRGALLVSDRPWALDLAGALARAGVPAEVVARGRTDLVDRPDLPAGVTVHTGLVRELAESDALDDVSGAIVASHDDETDQVALAVAVERLPRRRVWLLAAEPRSGVAAWAPPAFGPEVDHRALAVAWAAGHRVRKVPATDAPPGALVLVRLRTGGGWTAGARPPRPGDRLLVLDPARSVEGELQADEQQAGDAARRGHPEPG
jgi:NhaP-type Na+/H+ or K+/H+ antiporter